MNYAQIRQFDIANGEGIRTTLFVSGCTFNCKGCFNKKYQDFNYGTQFTDEIQNKIINYLKFDYVSGLSILGGEPFMQDKNLLDFIIRVKTTLENKTIWVWSGFTFEEILQDTRKRELLKHIDVLVDGQFVEELKDLTLKFKGSSNQRIIDVQKSLQQGSVVLWEN